MKFKNILNQIPNYGFLCHNLAITLNFKPKFFPRNLPKHKTKKKNCFCIKEY